MRISRKSILRNHKFDYSVDMTWNSFDWVFGTSSGRWARACAEAVELFGPYGHRYITTLHTDKITWHFCDPQDLLLFQLKFSEYISPC